METSSCSIVREYKELSQAGGVARGVVYLPNQRAKDLGFDPYLVRTGKEESGRSELESSLLHEDLASQEHRKAGYA